MNASGPGRPAIHPVLLLIYGIAGSLFWCLLFRGLAAFLPIADAFISSIIR